MSHPEIRVQHDAINAIIAAAQEILIKRAQGLVRSDGEPQRFALDYGIAQLGHVWMSTLDMTAAAGPIISRLRDQTGETASLNVLRGNLRTCVLEMTSLHDLSITWSVGRSDHVCRGASGKAILAFMSGEIAASMMRSLPKDVDRKRLIEELAIVRKNGFALSRGELIVGALAIAAPCFDQSGGVVGSIGVAGPQARLGDDWIMRCTKLLVASASELSVALGHATPSQTGTRSGVPRRQ